MTSVPEEIEAKRLLEEPSTSSTGKSSPDTRSPVSTSSTQDFLHKPVIRAALPFVNGFLSGSLATTIIQPIDTVKVRIQLTGEGVKGGPKPNPLLVGRNIFANEGFLALYSGLSAGYLRQGIYGTARLGLFGTFIRMFESRADENGTKVTFTQRAAAGLGAGAIGAAIGNPAEVALIRMQSDGTRPLAERAHYRSAFDALGRIARKEGVAALWSGAYPTVIRAMATNFGQLSFFAETKAQLQQRTQIRGQMQSVVASGVAGFFAAFFSLPFDFVKTRLQRQQKAPDGSVQYKGMADCFVKVARQEGPLRFYRGFGTYFMRMAPHTVIALICLDNLNRITK
jgi:hypothetical protein